MVLSAKALNIKEGLVPFFCSECGYRIGWFNENSGDIPPEIYCEECSKDE
jgi:hypothetical protein